VHPIPHYPLILNHTRRIKKSLKIQAEYILFRYGKWTQFAYFPHDLVSFCLRKKCKLDQRSFFHLIVRTPLILLMDMQMRLTNEGLTCTEITPETQKDPSAAVKLFVLSPGS
jgi:hypothetical protein